MINFHTGSKLLRLTKKHKKSISGIVILRETNYLDAKESCVLNRMQKRWEVSQAAIKSGLNGKHKSVGGMVGGEARKLNKWLKSKKRLMSKTTLKAATYALANTECNACMGRIVSCPTAGASGVLPGIMMAVKEDLKVKDEKILAGYFAAAGVGIIIAENATLAGAQGGCQAEIGSAAAMAAAGLTEIRGGTPEQCLNAAALALKNFLGLACDPVGGLVEVPCVKRNAYGVTHAMMASEMSLAGIESFIPFDEVVEAMSNIGKLISPKLRETAMGGLAVTDSAKRLEKKLGILKGED
ncbi:L-serine ammonia-lyase, iron-sulfur-dependent, subunit alpha [Patescibacteria group bacterium]|nr:L-serine ammonia-lyase, iron-sulfur-dependent, subunit alpha [Patescibacteria group bacterium]